MSTGKPHIVKRKLLRNFPPGQGCLLMRLPSGFPQVFPRFPVPFAFGSRHLKMKKKWKIEKERFSYAGGSEK